MRQKITNLYLNKTLLLISGIGAIVLWLVDSIFLVCLGNESNFAWTYFALTAILFIAYAKGEINIQKMLFGALLLFILFDAILITKFHTIRSYLLVFTTICQFIAHMFQQMDHTGKTPAVLVNQFVGFSNVLMFAGIVFDLSHDTITIANVETIIFRFAYFMTCVMIIAMETRVEAYKQIRTASCLDGTWDSKKKNEMKDKYFRIMNNNNPLA